MNVAMRRRGILVTHVTVRTDYSPQGRTTISTIWG